MVVLALALGYFGFDKFVLSPERQAAELATATKTAHREGRTEALVESYGEKSIAVLAFQDMSQDKDQEYLSDGIAEELLNLLAKMPELRVISRLSAFSYKGKNIKLAQVAEELNVAHVLEGSVCKAGHLGRQITAESLEQSIALYEQALAIDPGYAATWSGLAESYRIQSNKGLRPFDEGYALAREATEKALAIDPDYALANAVLAWIVMTYDNDLAAAARYFERALALEPANTDILRNAAALLFSLGRLEQSIALGEYVTTRDPVNPVGHYNLGVSYLSAGRWDEAIASTQTALRLSPDFIAAHYFIGRALLLKGELEAALSAMQREEFEAYRLLDLVMAHHVLGQVEASDEVLAELIGKFEPELSYNIAYALAYRYETERAFEWLDKAVEYGDPGLVDTAIEPLFSNIHSDPRWLPFLDSIGMLPAQLDEIKFEVTVPQ
jgi:TolB-like protein